MRRRANEPVLAPYLLLAPFLIVFGLFTAYPLVQSVILSTRQTFGPAATVYVGLDNFVWLVGDPVFWKAMTNTLIFTAGSVFVQLPIALGLALLLNRPGLRGRMVLRLVFFSPQLVGLVFVAMMAAVMLERRTGLVTRAFQAAFDGLRGLLGAVGLEKVGGVLAPEHWLNFGFLQDAVMSSLIGVALWLYAGFNMVYFLAALQNVDGELVEASLLDGAGPLQRFLNVTVPAIKPVAAFVVLLSIIGSLQLFELPYLLLNGGGPQNKGLTVVTYLYENGFLVRDLGYASAIGWVLALVLIAFAVAQRVLVREEAV